MFGKNPKRPPEKGDGRILKVQEIFPTLQGEGPHTGVPSVFIRLGGCNLACEFCDTEFESFTEMDLEDILDEVEEMVERDQEGGPEADPALSIGEANSPCENQEIFKGQYKKDKRQLIVITGGEPLRQNIAPLCAALIELGYTVQIETNGTLWRDLPQAVQIICSPKATGGKYHPLRADLLQRIHALKFIISRHTEPYTQIPEYTGKVETWLQPMDEGNPIRNVENIEHTLMLAQKHGCKVSLQTHKLFHID